MVETLSSSEPAEQKKPQKTRGDRLFDRAVYAGLNGVGTFLLTIPLAYWGDHGGGKESFEKGSKFFIEKFKMKPSNAKTVIRATTLGLGGTLMVIPVYFAEHFRTPMVAWLNRNFGNAQDKEAAVENPAPQTFASLIKGRVVAWCAVFSGFKVVEWFTKAIDHPNTLGNFEEKFSTWLCKLVGKETHAVPLAEVNSLRAAVTHAIQPLQAAEKKRSFLNKVFGEASYHLPEAEVKSLKATLEAAEKAVGAVETKNFKLGKLAALDVFATAAATTILYASSRFFARNRSPEKQKALAAKTNAGGSHFADAEEAAALPAADDAALPEKTISGEKHRPGMIAASHTTVQGVGA